MKRAKDGLGLKANHINPNNRLETGVWKIRHSLIGSTCV